MSDSYSNLKIFYHNEVLEKMAAGEIPSPIYVRLKLTNICNHHCAYCTYGSGNTYEKTENRDIINHRDMIPYDKAKEIVRDLGDMGVKAVTLSGGGEPLTYPYIREILDILQENNIDISLITNGQLLDGDISNRLYGAKWVRISFDSPFEDEYTQLRRVSRNSYKKVIYNIQEFAQKKDKDCVLGINFVVNRVNYHSVYEAAKMMQRLEVDNIKFAAVIENEPGYHNAIKKDVIMQIKRAKDEFESESFQIINNYEKDCEDKQFSGQTFPVCYTCRFVTVIAADQCVYLCHTRAYDSNAMIGDIREKSFKELWNSESTVQKLKSLNPKTDCKNFCVYEERNKLIEAYYNVNKNHVNFV